MDIDAWMADRLAHKEAIAREMRGQARKQLERDAKRERRAAKKAERRLAEHMIMVAARQNREVREWQAAKRKLAELRIAEKQIALATRQNREVTRNHSKVRLIEQKRRERMKVEGLASLVIRRDPRGDHITSASGYTRSGNAQFYDKRG